MSIRVQCTACGSQYRVADTSAGKRVKCRKCQQVFRVEAPARDAGAAAPVAAATAASPAGVGREQKQAHEREQEREQERVPAEHRHGGSDLVGPEVAGAEAWASQIDMWDAPPAEPRDDETAKAAPAGAPLPASRSPRLAGALAAAAAVCIVVVTVVVLNRSSEALRVGVAGAGADVSRSAPPLASSPVAGADSNGVAPAGSPAGVPTDDAETASKIFRADEDVPPGPSTARAAGTGGPGKTHAAPGGVAAGDPDATPTTKEASPKPVRWLVRPDPPRQNAAAVAKVLAIPVGAGEVVYPDLPSPFVVVVRGRTSGFDWEVWNLAQGSKAFAFSSPDVLGEMIVSDDGTLAAGVVPGRVNDVEVWSLKKGVAVERLREAEGEDTLAPVCFVGDDRLVTTVARSRRLTVWNLRGGKVIGEIELDANLEWGGTFAQSPGGNYLARVSDARLLIYNLAEGELAGDVPVPEGDGEAAEAAGVAFSPDGRGVAALFGGRGRPMRVVTWELKDARVTADFALAGDVRPPRERIAAEAAPGIRPIAWLADSSGWLLYGDVAVAGPGGKVLFRRPEMARGGADVRWRPGDRTSFLVLDGRGPARTLRAVPVPAPAASGG